MLIGGPWANFSFREIDDSDSLVCLIVLLESRISRPQNWDRKRTKAKVGNKCSMLLWCIKPITSSKDKYPF